MRFRLRTLLIVLAIGPPTLWLGAGLYDAYRWLATYPDPDPFYFTGPNPLGWLGVLVCLLAFALPVFLVVALFQRRGNLIARDRQERRRSNFFQA
jgi:hypothetical protein